MVQTVSQLFVNTIENFPKDNFILHKKGGKYVPISTEDFGNRVKHFALALNKMGLEPGDRLTILSENSPDWIMADMATLCLGGVTVPIYTTLMPEQIKYIIDNSDSKMVVLSLVRRRSNRGDYLLSRIPRFSMTWPRA